VRHIEVEKAIKRAMDKKAAGDEDVGLSRYMLKILGEDNLEITRGMLSNIHETGEWPMDFI